MGHKLSVDEIMAWCLPLFGLTQGSLEFSSYAPDRLASALAALHREVTWCDVVRAKFLSASGKQPFLRSWDAMAFAVTGTRRVLFFCLSVE